MNFANSIHLSQEMNKLIPGGAHTYAKGKDQFPENNYPILTKGNGCHVWDTDGNKFIEYDMGLRSVTLGHAFEPVLAAVRQQLEFGSNLGSASLIELECAETFLRLIDKMDMVKFAKNGSDVTTAAVKLARAYTGRKRVAICSDHPFFFK